MEETFLNKGILEKLTREGKSLDFYTIVNKVETLNFATLALGSQPRQRG
jgi:hypothetical protein